GWSHSGSAPADWDEAGRSRGTAGDRRSKTGPSPAWPAPGPEQEPDPPREPGGPLRSRTRPRRRAAEATLFACSMSSLFSLLHEFDDRRLPDEFLLHDAVGRVDTHVQDERDPGPGDVDPVRLERAGRSH